MCPFSVCDSNVSVCVETERKCLSKWNSGALQKGLPHLCRTAQHSTCMCSMQHVYGHVRPSLMNVQLCKHAGEREQKCVSETKWIYGVCVWQWSFCHDTNSCFIIIIVRGDSNAGSHLTHFTATFYFIVILWSTYLHISFHFGQSNSFHFTQYFKCRSNFLENTFHLWNCIERNILSIFFHFMNIWWKYAIK